MKIWLASFPPHHFPSPNHPTRHYHHHSHPTTKSTAPPSNRLPGCHCQSAASSSTPVSLGQLLPAKKKKDDDDVRCSLWDAGDNDDDLLACCWQWCLYVSRWSINFYELRHRARYPGRKFALFVLTVLV